MRLRRVRKTQIHNIQKTAQQKAEKQAQALVQLIDLPDFDVPEFFQTLNKNSNPQDILQRIPKDKQIDFFARNFENFLETQQQLMQLKLPQLDDIPKAKLFYLEDTTIKKQQENTDEATVMQIIDSFGSHVLEKNNSQILRVYQMICDMKKLARFEQYFNNYFVSKLFRQYYNSFVQSCKDYTILLKLKQIMAALKLYLSTRQQIITQQIQMNLNFDNSAETIRKQMTLLVTFIENIIKNYKQEFFQYSKQFPEIQVYLSKWIETLAQIFYQLVQPIIYELDQIQQILKALSNVLEGSKQAQSRGISLQRDIKALISVDLPLHMQKVVQVVLEAFDNLLKDDSQLYQFIYFQKISDFADAFDSFIPLQQKDINKKCSTQKAILLINSFIIILEPLCDEKWQFLQQNTINSLLDKVNIVIDQTKMHYWDYYHLFHFLDKLYRGKVRHRKFYQDQMPDFLKSKLLRCEKLSKQCWKIFQEKLANVYFNKILNEIPRLLWNYKKNAQAKQPPSIQPSTFSIELVISLDNFIKQIRYRMGKIQFEYLSRLFFEYIIYVVEYILYFKFHDHGKNDKIFLLKKKQQQFLSKAESFTIHENAFIKQERILKISYFNPKSLQKFAFEMYFMAEIYKMLTGVQKIQVEQFNHKIGKIYSEYVVKKTDKIDPINLEKKIFLESINKFVQRYQEKPQTFVNYLHQQQQKRPTSSIPSSRTSQAFSTTKM